MSETIHKIDKVIDLQERTLEEIRSLENQIYSIEKRLKDNENQAYDLKVECAENSKAIKYQWWIITFIGFLILLLFGNL